MSSKKPRPGVRGNDLFREINLPNATEPEELLTGMCGLPLFC